MQTTENTTGHAALNEGDRIRLAEDFGFFDQGDRGVLNAHDGITGEVLFDGGATGLIPLSMLVLDVGDFRLVHPDGQLGAIAYPTENEAVSAAERYGYAAFRVLRVAEEVRYGIAALDVPRLATAAA